MNKTTPTTVPADLHAALVKLLDIIPPILEDWIRTTGYGEIHGRDKAALMVVLHAKELHHRWLAESGITVEGVPIRA